MLIAAINPFFHPIKFLNSMFHSILLLIDGGIYWAFSQVYQIFIKLADARIFQDAFFSNFAKRIYAIIGVVMLFYLAYALLNALVDPDKATSGDKSLTKLAQNIVISLVLLGFLPTIFDYAYKIQGILFKENVIGAIIFGTGSTNSDSISKYGNYMAFTALNPFLNPGNYNVSLEDNYSWYNLKADIIDNGNFLLLPIMADWAVEPQETISEATEPNPEDPDNPEVIPAGTPVSLKYVIPLSTICGVVLLYITFSFCIDLGVRIIKFAFCQLIAPIPVVLRMLPGKKSVFDKWLKLTLTVYFEVFIRVGIMYMVIYFFSEIANMDIFKYAKSGGQGLIVLAIILMGLFAFAKQAPKLIGEMLGLDSGNIKLGIKDKLKAGGFFAAGSAVGAAIVSRGNPFAISRAWKKGLNDGNVKSVGEESQRRQQVLQARREGSTWMGRRVNDVRGVFGYGTTADVLDRRAANLPYTDIDGHTILTTEQVNEMKEQKVVNQSRISEIDEQVRVQKQRTQNHETARSAANSVLERSKTMVNRSNSAYKDTIHGGYGDFEGNLFEIKEFVKQLDAHKPDRDDIKYRDSNGNFNEQQFNSDLVEHANKMNAYNQEIAKIERKMVNELNDDAIAGHMKKRDSAAPGGVNTNADVDVELANNLEKLRQANSRVTFNQTNLTDATSIRTIDENYKRVSLDNEIVVNDIESRKTAYVQDNARIDRIEAMHKEQQEEFKQSNRYRAATADKNARGGSR